MKNVPSGIKDKYEILGIIGEGKNFLVSFSIFHLFTTGSYGVVLKARKRVKSIDYQVNH